MAPVLVAIAMFGSALSPTSPIVAEEAIGIGSRRELFAWHVIETKSSLPGAANELSLYAGESYWTGEGSALRRYILRLDGFVSANAPMKGGELITKPLIFTGRELHLNFSTSAVGGIRVELQKPDGTAIPGFALADCSEVFGDDVDGRVTWKSDAVPAELASPPVRLRFVLNDADLFAYQF